MSNDNLGWVKAHRKLLENPRFKDGDWLKVWVWMLLNASHKPHAVIFRGERIDLQPGQFTAGRFQIADATGVAESKVRRVLEWLKNDHQIDQQISNACSLFTITNWNTYQENDQQSDQPPAIDRPATDQPPTTKQECKNVKNGKKDAQLDDETWLSELQAQDIFKGINVRGELQKMKNWCANKRKIPSRRRLLNWLNNTEKPFTSESAARTYSDAELTLIAMGKR